MWTKLLYVNLPTALKPSLVEGRWHRPLISSRYRNVLKRTFLQNGIPWIHEMPKKKNPRHKMPKGHAFLHERPIRLAKIKKALENNAELELKIRQEKMNGRKLTGLDKVLKQALPSFINTKKDAAADGADSEGGLIKETNIARSGPKYADKKKEVERAKSL